jgi:23S rRNA-/tRNA-specific pseudouridylate synthase
MEYKYGDLAKAFLVHRLDQATSGLMIIAKSKEEARRITGMMQKESQDGPQTESVKKQYMALVCGEKPAFEEGLVR